MYSQYYVWFFLTTIYLIFFKYKLSTRNNLIYLIQFQTHLTFFSVVLLDFFNIHYLLIVDLLFNLKVWIILQSYFRISELAVSCHFKWNFQPHKKLFYISVICLLFYQIIKHFSCSLPASAINSGFEVLRKLWNKYWHTVKQF